jgi:prepilin-type N-terminal cleavage/methylation domain-containing protein
MNNSQKGFTIIELIVAIFIIVLFCSIIISDFPKIQRDFALSRAAYKLEQDLRSTQDMGLSGVQVTDANRVPLPVKGYGVYVNLTSSLTQYLIYADIENDQKFDGTPSSLFCDQVVQQGPLSYTQDCIIQIVNLALQNSSLTFKKPLVNITGGNQTSINFSPPDPLIKIDGLTSGNYQVGIILGLTTDNTAARTVWTNTSGLINVQ